MSTGQRQHKEDMKDKSTNLLAASTLLSVIAFWLLITYIIIGSRIDKAEQKRFGQERGISAEFQQMIDSLVDARLLEIQNKPND
jgi:hypothetical protein